MPKVYISQENSNIDYTESKRFGQITFVTNLEYSFSECSLNNKQILTAINEVVNEFKPSEDFIIMTGSPITFALLFHGLANKCIAANEQLRLLIWDKRTYQYKSVAIGIETLKLMI